MHALFRLPLVPAALLLAAPSLALAEWPLPDPVAPAVIGRPLDQVGPARHAPPRTATGKPAAARRVAAKPQAATPHAAKPAAAVAAVPGVIATQHGAKQAVDDRADPRMQLGDIGKGTHFARKPLGEGAYFGERHRSAVRKYYDHHPVLRPAVNWKIGEPVPPAAVAALLPRGLLAALPPVPPGHQYVELGGEVVLVASGSKMVVDGISRGRAQTALLAR